MPVAEEIDVFHEEVLGQNDGLAARPEYGRVVTDAQQNALPPRRKDLSDQPNEPALPQVLNCANFQMRPR